VKKIAAMLGAVALVSAGAAYAHAKDGVHLKGVVKAVGETSLTLVGSDKREVTVKATEKTEVTRGEDRSALSDVRSGERVVVHAVMTKKGDLEARLITLAKKKPSPASKPPGEQHGDHKH
jgi:hypothetical protein